MPRKFCANSIIFALLKLAMSASKLRTAALNKSSSPIVSARIINIFMRRAICNMPAFCEIVRGAAANLVPLIAATDAQIAWTPYRVWLKPLFEKISVAFLNFAIGTSLPGAMISFMT